MKTAVPKAHDNWSATLTLVDIEPGRWTLQGIKSIMKNTNRTARGRTGLRFKINPRGPRVVYRIRVKASLRQGKSSVGTKLRRWESIVAAPASIHGPGIS